LQETFDKRIELQGVF